VPSWTFEELEPLLPRLDALYVNYIAGSELALEDTLRLRRSFRGLMYGDLHSLFLGEPGPSARPPRALPRSGEWLSCFDVIQLNETELLLLSAGREWEGMLRLFAESGVKLVVVTLGPHGVRYGVAADLPADPLAWPSVRVRERRYRSGVVPAPSGELPGDPTGCGDVFGAAFVAGLLGRLPLEEAIVRAQRLAAEKLARADTTTLYERFLAAARPAC
jgi:sugar/nucleoside kinase (ribokinase family)